MIAGLGVDTIEIDRVARAMQNPRFMTRVYTCREQARIAQGGAQTAAGIFAAKEAVSKALGTGFSRGVRFLDVEILREEGAPPVAELHGKAKALLGEGCVHVSVSHDRGRAVAVAIIETL